MSNTEKPPANVNGQPCHCGRKNPPGGWESGSSRCDVCCMVDEVMDGFGEILVRHFPEATTGDLSPDRTVRLALAIEEAIVEWIDKNAPDHSQTDADEESYAPRAPTAEEWSELGAWIRAQYDGDDPAGLIGRSWVAVFDNYCSDCPGYGGKVMYVVWPASPDMCDVFTWEDGKMVHTASYE